MLAEIMLPPFLKEKLDEAPHRHVVYKALENFNDWFRSSRLPFFPDYTDHGIQHIQQVLATAANLIPDQARAYFSGADAAVLILAVLFHDSALHLTDAGVWQLIKGPADSYVPIAPFDHKGWAQTWDDFMFLARRWDDTKLAQVFGGNEQNGLPTASVRDPFAHWQNLTRTDNLLVGEFIRQQHPRLAHEMALYGVPGTIGALLKLDDSLPAEWRDLAGLIARSHGLPLRTCLDYLKNSPDFGEPARREYQSVHAVYLMALLRVADYIQIQGDRTSNRIFSYKKIYSSVSTIEHKVHQSVRDITKGAEDPEALFIHAKPAEVSVFLRLKEWLSGIQQELDGSWAVLGEVYGRYPEFRELGLTFRRVRSNLDDVAEFAKTVPYVPDRIRFDVARAELLKLLIGPLYGDDPSYGVRELMQNSIDAVREYDQFVLDNPQYKEMPRREQEADVVVELGPLDEATGYAVMTISDRGIGMTEATIRDYFLRAGASYRQSAEWRAAFETDGLEKDTSKILRSGRFGIGVLAAFLLGEEVEVRTRYIGSENGYVFNAAVDTEVITLNKVTSLEIGTIIKVRVSEKKYSILLKKSYSTKRPDYWDWYCFSTPTVKRIIPGSKGKTKAFSNVYSLDLQNTQWRKLLVDLPYDVYWTFTKAPGLTCNGLFVSQFPPIKNVPNEFFNHWDIGWNAGRHYKLSVASYPNLAIIDPDGKFPLNLHRNGLQDEHYLFNGNLALDMTSEMLALIYFNGPTKITHLFIDNIGLMSWAPPYSRGLVACKEGYGLRINTLLSHKSVERVIWHSDPSLIFSLKKDALVFAGTMSDDKRSNYCKINFVRNKHGRSFPRSRQIFYHHEFHALSIGDELESGEGYFDYFPYLIVEHQHDSLVTATTIQCPSTTVQIKAFNKQKLDELYNNSDSKYYTQDYARESPLLEEVFYPPGYFVEVTSEPWLLDELWQEHFGREWIPFALADRLAKFPKAAQFFKERYPQVVPDEVWALLGGKPSEKE